MNIRTASSPAERRSLLEEETQTSLTEVGNALRDEQSSIHCENLIGAISLPLGVAGPLHIHGAQGEKNAYVPLATTEGALVASVHRGAKATRMAGGIQVYVEKEGTTRGPVFFTGSVRKSTYLANWVQAHTEELTKQAQQTSSHLTLMHIDVKVVTNYVYIRFSYDTDQAMGMNMVTIATQAICSFIEKETGITCLTVAGNYDIDKKPAWLNVIKQRGYAVRADTVIPAKVVENELKTTAQKLFDVWLSKCMIGSALSGSLGFNSHFANIVAAFFAATGQDLAHVGEGSLGITTTQVLENKDLYMSIYMPAVLLGTVGGGTKLQTQTEARSITHAHNAHELAEVLSGAVLAGELSLLASLAAQTLARSHQALGR